MSLRSAVVVGCILAVSVPSVTLAASAKNGGEYSNQATLEFAIVAKSGKTAKLSVSPGKCAAGVSLTTTKPAKIKGATIKYSGAAKSMIGAVGTIALSGKFTSATKLSWTATVTVGACRATTKSTLTLR